MRFFLVLALLLLPAPAFAQEGPEMRTAKDILAACKEPAEDDNLGQLEFIYCHGYLAGVMDNITVLFGIKPETKFFCPPPEGITTEDLLKILTAYLAANPAHAEQTARMTLLIAYAKAYPCNDE